MHCKYESEGAGWLVGLHKIDYTWHYHLQSVTTSKCNEPHYSEIVKQNREAVTLFWYFIMTSKWYLINSPSIIFQRHMKTYSIQEKNPNLTCITEDRMFACFRFKSRNVEMSAWSKTTNRFWCCMWSTLDNLPLTVTPWVTNYGMTNQWPAPPLK